jgi:CTP:molybdopterin cytidylyltransferase MocA
MKAAVVILAAGHSSRMGQNKALLKFTSSFSFLDQLISEYNHAGVKDIIVVCQYPIPKTHPNINSYPHLNLKFTINNQNELGRGYSIYLGLKACKNNDWVFIQNIDNPFTSRLLIQRMLSSRISSHSLAPINNQKKGHPILIASSIVESIKQQDASTYYFKDIIAQFPQTLVPWDDNGILANINTFEEYENWIHHQA